MTDNRTYSVSVRLCLFILMSFSFLLAAFSCKNKNHSGQKDGRLKYEPQINNVEAIVLERRDFIRELAANGKLSAFAKSEIHFRSPGTINKIGVENGQRVEEGSFIASQDASEKILALQTARISLQKAELDFMDILAGQGYSTSDTSSAPLSVKKMAKMRSGYYAALNNLKKAELDHSGAVLKAPFRGKIADLKLKKHDMSDSNPFCSIIDDSVLDVDFSVLESEYPFIEKGLAVKISPFSGKPRVLNGKIVSINPKVDKNGQVSVKARVSNDGSLVDGMNVKIAVCRTVPEMLVVPKSAVVIRDNLEVLFCTKGGKAFWTYVHILMSNSSEYAVIANEDRGASLAVGDSVIVSGNLNLADGSEVTVKR